MEIYDVTGSIGRWQKRIIAIFFYLAIIGMWQNLSITFHAPNVPFRCTEPSRTIPGNESVLNYYDNSCEIPLLNTNDSNNESLVPCSQWEYDTKQFSETIVSEWDLVCNRDWLVSLSKSAYMFGFLLSVIVFGQMADIIGRFPTIVITYLITIASMFLTLLSSSYTMFAILRFFQAFGRTGLTTVGYVLVMEIIGEEHRTEIGVVLQMGWSVGFITLPALAYFVRNWFWFQVGLSVPFLPFLFAIRIIPESPRWLLTQGKHQKLETLLTKVVKLNKREIKGDIKDCELLVNKGGECEEQKRKTLFDILKMPRLRKRTFNMVFLWFVNTFMYYALTFNTNDLAGNPYLNFLLAGGLEFPSYALLYWAIRRYGRKPTLLGFMAVAGCSCLANAVAPQPGSNHAWVGTTMSMLGKFCVTSSFGLLYIYTNELYPTVVRTVALGSCSMFGRVGAILAPFIRELGRATHPSVPNVLNGALALTSGTLAYYFLPETLGRKLPDTLEEGERYGMSRVQHV